MAYTAEEWWTDLSPDDWLLDGRAIKIGWMDVWLGLQWQKAVLDFGPSPIGNLGPYFHVPDADDDCSHRLYPKMLRKPNLRALLVGAATVKHAGRSALSKQEKRD